MDTKSLSRKRYSEYFYHQQERDGEWNWKWVTLFIALNLIFIGYVIYSYFEGMNGNPKYIATYNLIHHPSWENFKIWFAGIMNDPVTDIILISIILLIPFPFLPNLPHSRLEYILSKIGLYFIVATLILGKPNYQGTGQSTSQLIWGWIVIGIIAIIGLASYLAFRYYDYNIYDNFITKIFD